MPVAAGAPVPNLGVKGRGASLWSTLEKQLLTWDGAAWRADLDDERPSYSEVTRVAGRVTAVVVWADATKLVKREETLITRTAGAVTSVVVRQYDTQGALLETKTTTFKRSATGQAAAITVVVT
jgi:hypothetical protein